jgi:membrane protein YdbS with pleckstrin-like domain
MNGRPRPLGLSRFYCSPILQPFSTPVRFELWASVITASWILLIGLSATWPLSGLLAVPVGAAFVLIWVAGGWQLYQQSHSRPIVEEVG